MAYYDAHDDTGELTSRMPSDVDLMQSGIGDKIVTFLMFATTFVTGVVVGFVYGWKLTLPWWW